MSPRDELHLSQPPEDEPRQNCRMEITDYQAKYFAHELTKRCSADSIEKLAGALVDAQVDLNPIKSMPPYSRFDRHSRREPFLPTKLG